MKLSEALRNGADKLAGRIEGTILDLNGDGNLCGCALGAIALGSGFEPESLARNKYVWKGKAYDYVQNEFPELQKHGVFVVQDGVRIKVTLQTAIMRRNDRLHWSFKRIANWLENRGF